MNLTQLKRMVWNSQPVYRKPMCLHSKQTKPKNEEAFDYEGEDTGCTRALEDARQSFRIGTYLPIIDTLIPEVRRRKFA